MQVVQVMQVMQVSASKCKPSSASLLQPTCIIIVTYRRGHRQTLQQWHTAQANDVEVVVAWGTGEQGSRGTKRRDISILNCVKYLHTFGVPSFLDGSPGTVLLNNVRGTVYLPLCFG
jgi:hypothetical protein